MDWSAHRTARVPPRLSPLGIARIRWAVVVAAGVGWSLGGCASAPLSMGEFAPDEPLPYSVGVWFDAGASSLGPAGEKERGSRPGSAPTLEVDGEGVARAVLESLREAPAVVGMARPIEAKSRAAAVQAARKGNLDFLVAASIDAPDSFTRLRRPLGKGALEIASWLFGGVPAWFVPSVCYTTDVRLTLHVVDLNRLGSSKTPASSEAILRHTVDVREESVSLWDRSSVSAEPLDYVWTIIVPPMFVLPEDSSLTSEAISQEVLEDLRERAGESLRPRLVEAERQKPLRVVFLKPRGKAAVEGGRTALSLGLFSRGGDPIRKLDVHRLAPQTPPERWVATPADLEAWNQALAVAGRGERSVRVDLPWEAPLVPGSNLIKVRVLREDGERVSRSLVVWCEEGR